MADFSESHAESRTTGQLKMAFHFGKKKRLHVKSSLGTPDPLCIDEMVVRRGRQRGWTGAEGAFVADHSKSGQFCAL